MAATIWVDGLFLTRHFAGTGKNRYLANLLLEMEKLTRVRETPTIRILLPSKEEIARSGLPGRRGFELVKCSPMRFRRVWRRGGSVPAASLFLRNDTLFLPEPSLILTKPKSLAVTIHDVYVLLRPQEFRSARGLLERLATSSALRHADLILTVSEHSKEDICRFFRVPEEKIVVAHLGLDSNRFRAAPVAPREREEVLKRYDIVEPYLLYVGAIEQKKNLARLANAYDLMRRRHKNFRLQLVLCGRPGQGYQELLKLFRRPDLPGLVTLTGFVPDDDLAVIYRGAFGFCMPSLYEGFGLPLLEALASGIPSMSSNTSSLPEIGGDAAIYFNPLSEEEMAAALERLVGDSELRETLSGRGVERAKSFTWESCARTTLTALERL
jgi:glycosyltransferase involved in cell wall biosynthesis